MSELHTPNEASEIEVVDPIVVSTEATNEVFEIIQDVVCLQEHEFHSETLLEDVMDSLDVVEITLEIEKKLNCRIEDSEVEEWKNVQDIVNAYQKRLIDGKN
jgi:acyl carrier protein